MLTGEKNQVMKYVNALPINERVFSWLGCFLFGLILTVFLWGCTMAPTKKPQAGNIFKSSEEIIVDYSRLGEPVTFEDLLEDLNNCRITYIGEKHTNIDHHKIQLQIIQALYRKNPNLIW